MLIEQLPRDSRTVSAMLKNQPPKQDGPLDVDSLSVTDQLLALIHDSLAVANWQRSGGKGKPNYIVPRRPRGHIRPKVVLPEARVRAHLRALGH